MFKWRSKLLFMLIVYFAGFATAVYFLAPVDEEMAASDNSGESYMHRQFDTEQFAEATSKRLHEFFSFAEDKASEVSGLIKEKLAQSHSGK